MTKIENFKKKLKLDRVFLRLLKQLRATEYYQAMFFWMYLTISLKNLLMLSDFYPYMCFLETGFCRHTIMYSKDLFRQNFQNLPETYKLLKQIDIKLTINS